MASRSFNFDAPAFRFQSEVEAIVAMAQVALHDLMSRNVSANVFDIICAVPSTVYSTLIERRYRSRSADMNIEIIANRSDMDGSVEVFNASATSKIKEQIATTAGVNLGRFWIAARIGASSLIDRALIVSAEALSIFCSVVTRCGIGWLAVGLCNMCLLALYGRCSVQDIPVPGNPTVVRVPFVPTV